jgi:hypothetical protein
VVVLIVGVVLLGVGLVVALASSHAEGDARTSGLIGMALLFCIGGLLSLLALRSLWSLWSGIQTVVLHQHGCAWRIGGKVKSCRWADIARVFSRVTFEAGTHGAGWTDYAYTIETHGREKLVLTGFQVDNLSRLIDAIKKSAYAVLSPPLVEQYGSGQSVTFGPVTVHRDAGITAGGKLYAWETILDVKVKQGSLLITMKDSSLLGGHHKVRASTIPNIEVLCQIIGVEPGSIELAYY